MKRRSIVMAIGGIGFGFIFLLAFTSSAKSGQSNAAGTTAVHVLMSTGLKAPMEAVREEAEKAVGHPLIIEYGPALSLKQMIEAGETFDVALLTPNVVDELIQTGKIVTGSRVDVARLPIGVGQRGDASKADVSTMEGLKQALLRAKSIHYTPNGASVPVLHKTFELLGINEEMNAKTYFGPNVTKLGPGETELTITVASEILPDKNLVYLGPLPPEVQVPTILSVGIGSSAGNVKAAKALIRFLQVPVIEPALKANGVER